MPADRLEKLKKLVDGESPEVDFVIGAMFHTKKKEARRFLMLVNSIVDYYLRRLEGDKVIFPIVYIPNTPVWGREVLLKFLIIKLALYFNAETRNRWRQSNARTNELRTEKDIKEFKKYKGPFKQYSNRILKQLSESYLGVDGHKNLIFCRDTDLVVSRTDKHKFITEFYGDTDDVCSDDNLTICHNISARDIMQRVKQTETETNIDNIFVLYTNNEYCNSLTEANLSRIMGKIKNCFVFYLSQDPLRLHHTYKRKIELGKKLPMLLEKEARTNKHFITLTENESLYLFNRETRQEHVCKDDDQFLFKDLIDTLYEQSEHPILERTHLSLCLDKEQDGIYSEYLRHNNSEYNQDQHLSIQYQIEFAESDILPEIRNFLSDSPTVGVILPYDATKEEKAMFKRLFPNCRRISFYNLQALKRVKGKNKIKESRVVNFVYRPHYAGTPFHKYPNSFDPFIPNPGQRILEVINGFVFADMYARDKYKYENVLCDLLDSEYRQTNLDILERPTKPEGDVYEETEFDDERPSSRPIRSFKITFADGHNESIQETELVIVSNDSYNYVCRMRELEETDVALQKLSEVEDVLETFMEDKVKDANKEERTFRRHFCNEGKITEEEYNSGEFLWKILLRHRVEAAGSASVYNDIMPNTDNRVSEVAFKNWYSAESAMILPRDRKNQIRLMEYLGLKEIKYLTYIRSIKRAAIRDTKQSNSMKDRFMLNYLFQDIDEDKFHDFFESDINDILRLDTKEDLEALLVIIKEKVKPVKVTSIQ